MRKIEISACFKKVCIAVTAFMILAHMYAFTNGVYLYDAVDIYRGGPSFSVSDRYARDLYWWIDLGMSLPWFAGIWATVLMILSVYFICEILEIQTTWGIVLTSGLCAVDTAIIAEQQYTGQNYYIIIPLLEAVLAAWVIRKSGLKPVIKAVMAMILIALSGGTYAAMVSVAPTLLLVSVIFDILKGGSGKENWTIVRPYITYNNERLQLGIYEKELWLHRVLHGQTVVFPKDMARHITTLSFGEDVARGIAALVGNQQARRQTVHITTNETIRWGDVVELYQKVFFDVTGKQMKVKYIDSAQQLRKDLFNQYQIKYDRMLDRIFDNSKIMQLADNSLSFVSPKEGLEKCFREFLNNPSFRRLPSVKMTAWMDMTAKEKTPLKDFSDRRKRAKYIVGRYTPYFKIKR